MTLTDVLAAAAVLGHAVRPTLRLLARLPGQAPSRAATQEQAMSETVPSPIPPSIIDRVRSAAAWALAGLQHVDAEWAAIQSSPIYGPIVGVAVQQAVTLLQKDGVPITPLVNISGAVTDELSALAKAHPAISTP